MFGKNNKKAEAEIGCFNYCLKESMKHFRKGDFKGASVYLDNADRSLKELEKLKEESNGQVRLSGNILRSWNDVNGRF